LAAQCDFVKLSGDPISVSEMDEAIAWALAFLESVEKVLLKGGKPGPL
jgi:hypothetical protein